MTIVQPRQSTSNVLLRRRYPLMLSDTQSVKKITKFNSSDAMNQGSPTGGPTIHEIDAADVLYNSTEPESTSSGMEYISSE